MKKLCSYKFMHCDGIQVNVQVILIKWKRSNYLSNLKISKEYAALYLPRTLNGYVFGKTLKYIRKKQVMSIYKKLLREVCSTLRTFLYIDMTYSCLMCFRSTREVAI